MIGIGWIARRKGVLDAEATRQLSRLLATCIYPALIFSSMTRHFDVQALKSHWILPVGAFGIMFSGFIIGLCVERWFTDPHSRQGHVFLFQCTINNYSFLPMPLALMLWGETGVANLIFSTLGPELAIWTLGVYALSGRKLNRDNFKQLLNPPLLTILATLAFIVLRDIMPIAASADSSTSDAPLAALGEAIRSAITLLGGATIPLAMIIAGSRMAGLRVHHLVSRTQMALTLLRLVIIPAAVVLMIMMAPFSEESRKILILVAIMPSAVTSVVLSEIYHADSEFAAATVLMTHLLCLLTIPLWLLLLKI